MNITKERIDEVILKAYKNNSLGLINQIFDAMDKVPEHDRNPFTYAIMAASISQGQALATVKETFYELFAEKEE